jgi:hypothetical protein
MSVTQYYLVSFLDCIAPSAVTSVRLITEEKEHESLAPRSRPACTTHRTDTTDSREVTKEK